jgi:hypothetical protein
MMTAANIVQTPTGEAKKLIDLLESDISRALGEASPELALIHILILRQNARQPTPRPPP